MEAGAAPSNPPLDPGTTFGRYAIVGLIGQGGMGAVYEATHLELNKRVALKILPPDVAQMATWRARFLREAQAAASLHHPNVAEVFDVGEHDGMLYLVMEFLEGEDLAALLERERVLTIKRTVDLLLPVCAALSVTHEQGIVHRDIKPENVFLATSRHGGLHPKLLDFGISKVPNAEPRITSADALVGTPFYMSPEQAGGNEVDARGDQYALGVLLYECTTGHRPYDGSQLYPLLLAIVRGEVPPPRSVRPDLPEEFEAIILRAMALAPDDRFPDIDALGRALLPFASRTAQGIWHPVFRDETTPALPCSVVPAEPIDLRPTLPDASVEEAAPLTPPPPVREPISRSQRHARRIPRVATFVALALGLAGASLVAVARHPAAELARRPAVAQVGSTIALAVPTTLVLPRDVAPAPAPATTPAPAVGVEPTPVVEPSPVSLPEAASAPRSHRRAPARVGVARGSNGAPIVE